VEERMPYAARKHREPWLFVLLLSVAAGCIASGAQEGSTAALFVLVTEGRIAHDGGASRGVGWGDFDQDGDPDLVVSNTAGQWNAFYRNTLLGVRNDGRETAEATASTLEGSAPANFVKMSDPDLSPFGGVASARGNAEGVSWVDYDGDGDLDLHIVTRGRQDDLLFENREDEGLTRVSEGELVRTAGSSMACWADVDGDGWLDVFLVAYRDDQRNTLLRNLGGGRFESMRASPVTAGHGTGRACAWGDPDDDGLPDLYVGNAREPNGFFRNRGDFVFEPAVDAGHIIEDVGYSYGLSWADFDGDGDHDLFVANFDKENVLYQNDGAGNLDPVRGEPIAEETAGASKGHAWADYDLDGDLDLFVANGTYGPDMRNFLYLNRGDGSFVRELTGEFLSHADTSAGAAWADYDRDGDLDVFVANWGSSDQVNRFYRNTASETTGRGWVSFRLRSSPPNTHGWGAKVRAKVTLGDESRWMTRWNIPTTGYGSQNDLAVHFGLGAAERVDSLVIRWPSGHTDVHTGVAGRRFWTVTEDGALEPAR
jgi:hypothetical protein